MWRLLIITMADPNERYAFGTLSLLYLDHKNIIFCHLIMIINFILLLVIIKNIR